ncbi:MAG: hypothetical protein JNL01_06320 [Bdellovibrionales bacterium]|nr:hypothetical protein [Bdellovibrionales bacterium]
MKFFISMLSLMQVFSNSVWANESGADRVRSEIKKFRAAVLVDGIQESRAIESFADSLEKAQITPADVMAFLRKYGTQDETILYHQTLETAAANRPEILSEVLQSAMQTQGKMGSDFRVSCGLGLGVSVPVILAGLTAGIVFVWNLNRDQKIELNYASRLSRATSEYYVAKGPLEVSLASQAQQVAINKTQMSFLQQKIDSGIYSAQEVEAFNQEISMLKVANASIQNSTEADTAKIKFLNQTYDQEVQTLLGSKNQQMTRWKSKQTLRAIVSAATLGVGIPLFVATVPKCK